MKKWIMFCLTLLISLTLVACNSTDNNNNNNEDTKNNDETSTNTEEQIDTDSQEDVDSENYDFDPNGENVVVLQKEQDGAVTKLTYKADGDKVIEQRADNLMPYESLGVTSSEEAEELLLELATGFHGVEGVTHELDFQEDKVTELLSINYEEAEIEEVNELAGASFEGDLSEGISLKRSVDLLLEQGFEIVE